MKVDFGVYQSPFTWRYGSPQMRALFSEINRRKTWRKVWVALARAQHKAGLLTKEEFEDIAKGAKQINLERSRRIEKLIYHDLMAEVRAFAESAKAGGGKIHLGATSADITDNADIILIKEASSLIEAKLKVLIKSFALKIDKYQNTVCMGYTHLQPAEPTTLGYRFCLYAQDLLVDLKLLSYFLVNLKAKGIKGAVGTSASYVRLLADKSTDAFKLENEVVGELGLSQTTVAAQTYPRKSDLHLTYVLASIAQSIHKFCFDLRIMQSPGFGEWSEPISEGRVGSSAMPFKRNPDKAEKICSLARYIATLPGLAFANAAGSLLERTLDDSANRRIFIAEGFLATDEILTETNRLIKDMVVYENSVEGNLAKYGPFAATEVLMMEAVKNGADRQRIHEAIRKITTLAWQKINNGEANPLVELVKKDKIITKFIKIDKIQGYLDPEEHIGLTRLRCSLFLKELRRELKE